jgi:chromosome segregation ATPase
MSTKKDKSDRSPLVAAAEGFDAELRRFAQLTDGARKGGLGSQKALERAAEGLKEVADCEEQLQAHARDLMAALASARDEQQAQAELLHARAKEIEQRTAVFADLMRRFQALGKDAAELNAMGQRLSLMKKEVGADSAAAVAKDPELAAGLRELSERMARVGDSAQELATAAREAEFEDIARQGESLRQQLMAARNKVTLLHGALHLN